MEIPDRETLRQFAAPLKRLRELAVIYRASGADEEEVFHSGICNGLSCLIDRDEAIDLGMDGYDLVEVLSPHWPEYSGVRLYPVPHPEVSAQAALDLYSIEGPSPLWTGVYGDTRMRLLDFLITVCERGSLE